MKPALRLLTIPLLVGGFAYSGMARADDITIDPVPFVSTASPSEVRAELDAFKKSGVNPWSNRYDPLRSFRSSKTRAEVTAEYINERGAVAAMTGEDSGSSYLAERRDSASSEVRMANKRPNVQQ